MALALMRAGEDLSNERYRQVSGVDSRVATRELGDLAGRALVQMRGVGRWAEYMLHADVFSVAGEVGPHDYPTPVSFSPPAPAAQRRTRGDRRHAILRLLQRRGPLTRAEIEGALRLHQTTVSRWLRTLRQEDAIEIMSANDKDPGAKYRLITVSEDGRSLPDRSRLG